MLVVAVGIAAAIVSILVARGSKPIALRNEQTVGRWSLRVDSVDWNPRFAPPGAREIEVVLQLGNRAGQAAAIPFGFYVEGQHGIRYRLQSCGGQADLFGRFVTGHATFAARSKADLTACFTVAEDDVNTLRLHATSSLASDAAPTVAEFALRRT